MSGKWRVQFRLYNIHDKRWKVWTSKNRSCCWMHAYAYAYSFVADPKMLTKARVYKER